MLRIVDEDEARGVGGLKARDGWHGYTAVADEAASELLGKIAEDGFHGVIIVASGKVRSKWKAYRVGRKLHVVAEVLSVNG